MGVLIDRVNNTFDQFERDGDLFKFAREMVDIGDYSIRSQENARLVHGEIVRRRKKDEACEFVALFIPVSKKEMEDVGGRDAYVALANNILERYCNSEYFDFEGLEMDGRIRLKGDEDGDNDQETDS